MAFRTKAIVAATLLVTIGGAAVASQGLISQKGKTFTPADLELTVGTKLTIPNADAVQHNVTVRAPDGTGRNWGTQKPGDTIDILLEQKGEYGIRCGIHPKMKLSVMVR